MKIVYRPLVRNECHRIKEIDASQYIGRAWREVNGSRQLVEINYQEQGYPNGYENHLENLVKTVKAGGTALGAWCEGRLAGFCTVNNDMFGDKYQYVLLDQLFVTYNLRGQGIGKALFLLAAKAAREKGAEKLYICAGSSEETIAFYFAIGCEEAKEINHQLYQLDPRDFQMEFDIKRI